MKLVDAKNDILALIKEQIGQEQFDNNFDLSSPDSDVGKLFLLGEPARIIAPFNGFFVNINLNWFTGGADLPVISGGPFHWVIFSICAHGSNDITDYYICDYHKLRSFVLSFSSKVYDHRDHRDWRGHIHVESPNLGYFRWGDEELNDRSIEDRIIPLNNISEIIGIQPTTLEGYLSELDKSIDDSKGLSREERLARLSKAEKPPQSIVVKSTNYRRNPDVIVEVLSRADGICENCDSPAPFIRRSDKTPYLEVHHILQLSKGGNDTVNNAVAICPNCHRELHFGIDS